MDAGIKSESFYFIEVPTFPALLSKSTGSLTEAAGLQTSNLGVCLELVSSWSRRGKEGQNALDAS